MVSGESPPIGLEKPGLTRPCGPSCPGVEAPSQGPWGAEVGSSCLLARRLAHGGVTLSLGPSPGSAEKGPVHSAVNGSHCPSLPAPQVLLGGTAGPHHPALLWSRSSGVCTVHLEARPRHAPLTHQCQLGAEELAKLGRVGEQRRVRYPACPQGKVIFWRVVSPGSGVAENPEGQ